MNYLELLHRDLVRRYGPDYRLVDLEIATDTNGGLIASGSVQQGSNILIFEYEENDKDLYPAVTERRSVPNLPHPFNVGDSIPTSVAMPPIIFPLDGE